MSKSDDYKRKAKEIQWCMDYLQEHLQDDSVAEWADGWNELKKARDAFLKYANNEPDEEKTATSITISLQEDWNSFSKSLTELIDQEVAERLK